MNMMKDKFENILCKLFINPNWSKTLIFINKLTRWYLYRAQFNAILKQFQIDVILDVGANQGQFGKTIRYIFKGEIHSFEPVSNTFQVLKKTSSLDKKWHIHHYALGKENASQTIYVANHSVFSSLLKSNEYCKKQFGEDSTGKIEESITIKRLDSILKEIIPNIESKKILLKMDTQGFDMNVFEGLGEYLKYVYAIQTELSLIPIYDGMPHWTENVSTFEKDGFRVSGMYPVNWDSEKVIEYDCLMTKI